MECAAVLLVMPRECSPPLLKVLKSLDVDVLAVEDCQQARELLQTRPAVEVIITQVTLADGNWCDLFKYLVDRGSHGVWWSARRRRTRGFGPRSCGAALTICWWSRTKAMR